MTHMTKVIYHWMLSEYIKTSNSELYTDADLKASMEKIETINLNEEQDVMGIRFCAHDTGHVLGPAMFTIDIAGLKILYTSDVSRQVTDRRSTMISNVLIIKSAYGTHNNEKREDHEECLCFTASVVEIVQRGGRCLIPILAPDRAHELLSTLDDHWSQNSRLHQFSISYSSSYKDVYQTHINENNDDRHRIAVDTPFEFQHISEIKDIKHLRDMGPGVVMALPGMSSVLFEVWSKDANNGVIIADFHVEGTLPSTILSKPGEFTTMSGQTFASNMSAKNILFPEHTDYKHTIELICVSKPSHVVLAHAEQNEMSQLRAAMKDKDKDAKIPFYDASKSVVSLLCRGDRTSKTLTNIKDMNEDCKREVFQKLLILDLARVADVCTEFRKIAKDIFRRSKTIVKLPLDACRQKRSIVDENADNQNSEIFLMRASRIFRNFGADMKELQIISVDKNEEKLFAIITQYCAANLIGLNIQLLLLETLPNLQPIFQKLEKLDMYCQLEIDERVPEWLTNIKDLTLHSQNERLWESLFRRTYEKLEKIRFRTMIHFDGNTFNTFVARNGTIKDIDVSRLRGRVIFPPHVEHIKLDQLSLLHGISFRTLQLKSLAVRNSGRESRFILVIVRELSIGKVKLKHLELKRVRWEEDPKSQELCDAVSELSHLDTLAVDHLWYNGNMEALSPKLHRLSELLLRVCNRDRILTVNELEQVIKRFPNLKRFKIFSAEQQNSKKVEVDSPAFERFAKTVEERGNNVPLEIYLDHAIYDCTVPENLNEKVLRVKTNGMDVYDFVFN